MHYTVCPTSEDDLNWVDWYIFGHEDEVALGEPLKAHINDIVSQMKATVEQNGEDWDPWMDKDNYFNSIKAHLESKGYVVYLTRLTWYEHISL